MLICIQDNVYVDGVRVIDAPSSSNIGDAVALSLNPCVNRVQARLAMKGHNDVPENYADKAFY